MANARKARPNKAVGRKRRALGLTLLAPGIAVAALWAQSRWWYRGYEAGAWAVVCERGVLWVEDATGSPLPAPGATPFMGRGWVIFSMADSDPRWAWELFRAQDLSYVVNAGGTGYVNALGVVKTYTEPAVPWGMITPTTVVRSPGGAPIRVVKLLLWPVPLVLLGIGTSLLVSGHRARRRAMTGVCTGCGYSLAGLGPKEGTTCPECGKQAAAGQWTSATPAEPG